MTLFDYLSVTEINPSFSDFHQNVMVTEATESANWKRYRLILILVALNYFQESLKKKKKSF